MSNSEGSARVFAGLATFLVVFFAPRLLPEMFGDSFPTVLWGLFSLAAAALVIQLVRLHQRVKRLEMQTYSSRLCWRSWRKKLTSCCKRRSLLPFRA